MRHRSTFITETGESLGPFEPAKCNVTDFFRLAFLLFTINAFQRLRNIRGDCRNCILKAFPSKQSWFSYLLTLHASMCKGKFVCIHVEVSRGDTDAGFQRRGCESHNSREGVESKTKGKQAAGRRAVVKELHCLSLC